jgi:hypothetical protein
LHFSIPFGLGFIHPGWQLAFGRIKSLFVAIIATHTLAYLYLVFFEHNQFVDLTALRANRSGDKSSLVQGSALR